jgi:Immunity protein 51
LLISKPVFGGKPEIGTTQQLGKTFTTAQKQSTQKKTVIPLRTVSLSLYKKMLLMFATFPFELIEFAGETIILAPIENPNYTHRFLPIFQQYGYSGNGYSWEIVIQKILAKEAPELLGHIDFDAENNCFFAYIRTREHQQAFAQILCPIFQDLSILAQYLEIAKI